jgi:hypothetical protein
MFSHPEIWNAIDRLAKSEGFSPSGLAKLAGLDPTTFNKSKRTSPEGKPRWPSTESLSKILGATGYSFSDFARYLEPDGAANDTNKTPGSPDLLKPIPIDELSEFVPQIKPLAQTDIPPARNWLWDKSDIPLESHFYIEIKDDSYNPLISKGTLILACPVHKAIVNGKTYIALLTNKKAALYKLHLQQTNNEDNSTLVNLSNGESVRINTDSILLTLRIDLILP